jgi:acyl-CoA synthetase (AMP-forming)/AMP-acid ligase II
MTTIATLLAGHNADQPAIGAPGRAWLSYGHLRRLSQDVASQLRDFGICAQDRVAIVLPNGPEMATAFVSIAQAAVTAPLNPSYQQQEYKFYLDDLKAKALVVAEGYDGPAVAAANECGVAVLRLQTSDARPAGQFTLAGDLAAQPIAASTGPSPDQIALILHTSGTTSRPKIVPLLHSNVAASALHICDALALSASDRCMNVMPLFHIHGLIAAVMASLKAGASVWCAPGFDALKFFGWMKDANPTWYTAVPTMHQAILARAERNADVIAARPLRFLRSSSASLPAYGMTEAAHQMASNPLPPRAQKPGSVGVAAGPLLQIAHEIENHLISGTGEIVISGPNVTPGYESNPDANAKNFFECDGRRWFRTGDQGALDLDGYLSLTGRLKEIINRGGEKISPFEVDGVLMDHPAVVQVVTFATPHPKLGEEVAAAVVLREGHTATEREIRDFAAGRMADFKVPRRVVILAEIPKGATGKLQRIGLAEKLGLGPTD